jgi:hypothetical protein
LCINTGHLPQLDPETSSFQCTIPKVLFPKLTVLTAESSGVCSLFSAVFSIIYKRGPSPSGSHSGQTSHLPQEIAFDFSNLADRYSKIQNMAPCYRLVMAGPGFCLMAIRLRKKNLTHQPFLYCYSLTLRRHISTSVPLPRRLRRPLCSEFDEGWEDLEGRTVTNN